MAESSESPMPERRFVCTASSILLKGGGCGVIFREVKDGGDLTDERIFGVKQFRSVRIGNVYGMKADEKQCIPSSLRWIEKWPHPEQSALWQQDQLTADLEKSRKMLLASAPKNKDLEAILLPVRQLYLKSRRPTAFEVVVLRYLRSGEL